MASFAELLEHRYAAALDETARGYIHQVVDGAHRLRLLILDVLEYARIGRAEVAMEAVDLNAVAAEVLADLDISLREADAKVDIAALPRVRGHASRLAMMLQNLVSNALKYRSKDRPLEIRLTAARQGGTWEISVADNGIGFDPMHAERIFRPFQRLHPKEAYPGSGLGLAIARRIIELHGGRISASSRPDVGSTFTFSLPADE